MAFCWGQSHDMHRLVSTLHDTGVTEITLRGTARINRNDAANVARALRDNTTLQCITLDILHMRDTPDPEMTQTICTNRSITEFRVYQACLSSDFAQTMAYALGAFAQLKQILMRNCTVGEGFIDVLMQEVGRSKTITKLDMRVCHGWSSSGTAIADAMRANTSLVDLGFCHCDISASETEHIARAAASLTNLNMNDMNDMNGLTLGVNVACVLANALRPPTRLRKIALVGMHITALDTIHLADVIQTNTTLKELDLSYNNIGTEGAEALARALCTNAVITKLSAQSCLIDTRGVRAFADMLRANTTLVALDLSDNSICAAATQHIVDVLCTNTTLNEIDLHCTEKFDFTDGMSCENLIDMMRANTSLWYFSFEWDHFDLSLCTGFVVQNIVKSVLEGNRLIMSTAYRTAVARDAAIYSKHHQWQSICSLTPSTSTPERGQSLQQRAGRRRRKRATAHRRAASAVGLRICSVAAMNDIPDISGARSRLAAWGNKDPEGAVVACAIQLLGSMSMKCTATVIGMPRDFTHGCMASHCDARLCVVNSVLTIVLTDHAQDGDTDALSGTVGAAHARGDPARVLADALRATAVAKCVDETRDPRHADTLRVAAGMLPDLRLHVAEVAVPPFADASVLADASAIALEEIVHDRTRPMASGHLVGAACAGARGAVVFAFASASAIRI